MNWKKDLKSLTRYAVSGATTLAAALVIYPVPNVGATNVEVMGRDVNAKFVIFASGVGGEIMSDIVNKFMPSVGVGGIDNTRRILIKAATHGAGIYGTNMLIGPDMNDQIGLPALAGTAIASTLATDWVNNYVLDA